MPRRGNRGFGGTTQVKAGNPLIDACGTRSPPRPRLPGKSGASIAMATAPRPMLYRKDRRPSFYSQARLLTE